VCFCPLPSPHPGFRTEADVHLVADRVPAAEEHTSAGFGISQLLEDHGPSFLFNSVMPIVLSLPGRLDLAN